MSLESSLFSPLTLPNGARLKNRIIKSAMSDSLGDGRGNPTGTQARLYEHWAAGGVAASIIGEVQGDPRFAEKPGNLVLGPGCDVGAFKELARRGRAEDSFLWVQLGHAGALTPPAIGTPKGPSRLDLPELTAAELTLEEIQALPDQFAATARHAESLGFSGVQIHAAHGFLLSQFLSPLFNRRTDAYGGSISHRMRLLIDVVEAVRAAVTPEFTLALKLNSSDQLEGGLQPEESLEVIRVLDRTGLGLIDISGGTYFPGAPSSSDRSSKGPYFLDFAATARRLTSIPLMLTGGIKRRTEAEAALLTGDVDVVGLARALALDPALALRWKAGGPDPDFPRFDATPPGGVTAWYTMRLTELGEDRDSEIELDPIAALEAYEHRDEERASIWNAKFRDRLPASALGE